MHAVYRKIFCFDPSLTFTMWKNKTRDKAVGIINYFLPWYQQTNKQEKQTNKQINQDKNNASVLKLLKSLKKRL